MNLNENEFLENIQTALADVLPRRKTGILAPEKPENCQQRLGAIADKSPERLSALLELLKEKALPINLDLAVVKNEDEARDAIIKLVSEKKPEYGTQKKVAAWCHPLIDSLGLDTVLADMDIPLIFPPGNLSPSPEDCEQFRQEVIESFIGITSADYCVCDTATLTMKSRAGQPRSVSLVPSIHVAVIREDQLLENLTDLYFLLQWSPEEQDMDQTNCMTFISGPSKTGDIELVMVHGAHGPREVYLFVIAKDQNSD